MPAVAEIVTDKPITEDEDLGPGLDPSEVLGRLEHSRIVGDYYRDLSLNYLLYEQSGNWPDHPFPNEKYTYSDV